VLTKLSGGDRVLDVPEFIPAQFEEK